MTGTLTLMQARKHTTYEWDTELVTSNGKLSTADVKAEFDRMMSSGGTLPTAQTADRSASRSSRVASIRKRSRR